MEELKRMKSLKKQEIMNKIEKIKEIAGDVEGFDYSALDLEGDYDPEKHRSVMDKVFNDMYYDHDVSGQHLRSEAGSDDCIIGRMIMSNRRGTTISIFQIFCQPTSMTMHMRQVEKPMIRRQLVLRARRAEQKGRKTRRKRRKARNVRMRTSMTCMQRILKRESREILILKSWMP